MAVLEGEPEPDPATLLGAILEASVAPDDTEVGVDALGIVNC